MASISAAVTVFCRQAGDVCLCDTDKIYLAADTTTQPVLQGTVAPKGVTESQKQSVSILKSDKWCVQDHLDTQETQFKNHIVTVMQLKKKNMHHMFTFTIQINLLGNTQYFICDCEFLKNCEKLYSAIYE